MSIKADRWIREMAASHQMIEPFEPGQVRERDGERIVSYGTSSYGYDVRCSDEFKIFTNIESVSPYITFKDLDSINDLVSRRIYFAVPVMAFARSG